MEEYSFKYNGFIYTMQGKRVSVVSNEREMYESKQILDLSNEYKFEDILCIIKRILDAIKAGESFKEDKYYEDASRHFEQAANLLEKIGDKSKARDYYAYAAIMKENSEKWRSISYLWYKASGKMGYTKDYTDFNSLQHTYPTISIERWGSFEEKEKVGRAIQYAAYSEDNFDGPTDSYWLYEEAVYAYKEAGKYRRMIECLISATNRYVKQYNKVSDKLISLWKEVLRTEKMKHSDEKLIILAFDEIYKNMNQNETEKALFFYIESRKLQIKINFIEHHFIKGLKGVFEYLFSSFGTSAYKMVMQVLIMVLGIFPYIFTNINCKLTFKDAIIVSINNFLGITHITSNSYIYYFTGIAETLYSYFILVVISTYVINRVVRDLH